jgi:DNA replication protein DnaT
MKILISKNATLNAFCKNPIQIIETSNNGAVRIIKNKQPIFYAMTPDFLKKIFDIKYHCLKQEKIKENINNKFSMHANWTPDKDFIRQAALWGIFLNKEVSEFELASFISYWQEENCIFYHMQWQQKLARSIYKSRMINNNAKQKRDITFIPKPDKNIPNGFRGK